MPQVVVGPLLRYVDDSSASIWVETDEPCTVSVLDASARTFTVHGHHYALVEVSGLATGSRTDYAVELDGVRVWPEPDNEFPPSVITTVDENAPVRLLFGSCRTSVPHDAAYVLSHGVDVLRAYAYDMAGQETARC